MPVELKYNKLDCYKKDYTQVFCKEETQDSVVPDTMPDISEILDTSAILTIRSKDVSDSKFKIEAEILANVCYLSEEQGSVKSLNVTIPVYISGEDPSINEFSKCFAELKLSSLETKMLNPRKVMVKAEVKATVSCFNDGCIEICSDIDSDEKINLLQKTMKVCVPNVVTEKTFILCEDYAISPSSAAASEILSRDLQLIIEETKSIGSKIVFKAAVKSTLLYCSADGIPEKAEFNSSFSQIIDAETIVSGENVRLSLIPSGVHYDIAPDDSGRTVSMELHCVAQIINSESCDIEYLADAYSNYSCLELEREEKELIFSGRIEAVRNSVRVNMDIPESVGEIIKLNTKCVSRRITDSKILAEMVVKVLYKTVNGIICHCSKNIEICFDLNIGDNEKAEVTDIIPIDVSGTICDNGIDLRVSADALLYISESGSLSCICDANIKAIENDDTRCRPSLVILKLSHDDDLWDVAKSNCSTVERIISVNKLTDADAPWSKMILVPAEK